MIHQTTEHQLASQHPGIVPTVYVELSEGHEVSALSLDGAIRLAADVAKQFNAVVLNFGTCGGSYNMREQAAWLAEQVRQQAPGAL